MADLADRADKVTQQHLNHAISRIAVPKPDDGSDYCELCGEEVPEARATLGYSTCVPCQEERESLAGGRR